MIHNLKLDDNPFKKIKSGNKNVEMRLNDERRKYIQNGDMIIFFNRENPNLSLLCSVLNVRRFKTFKELYEKYPKTRLGYKVDEKANYQDMYQYYKEKDCLIYGALAIEIKLVKSFNSFDELDNYLKK